MSVNEKEALEQFDDFLMIMDEQTDSLELEGEKRGIELDRSVESLGNLEELFTAMTENADKEKIEGLIVLFARYLGEIVCDTFRGKWILSLHDPKNINYNSPVVIDHAQEGLEFSPLSAMRAFSIRKKPGLLKQAVYADIDIQPVDLSDLSEY